MSDEQAVSAGETSEAGETTVESWDTWLASQDEAQRAHITGLYETSVTGLKSALKAERDRSNSFEKKLREAAKKESGDGETKLRLTQLADELSAANRRANFYETASKAETGLVDVKAAWIIASSDAEQFIASDGSINFEALKTEHPSLFAAPAAPASAIPKVKAGTGINQKHDVADMNSLIRNLAGRN